MEDLQKRIEQLEKEIRMLKMRRIAQYDVIPGAIKKNAMGEANKFISGGLTADRPDGESVTGSVSVWFDTSTNKLYIWNGTAYKSVTLT